jgi:hypothetical protein
VLLSSTSALSQLFRRSRLPSALASMSVLNCTVFAGRRGVEVVGVSVNAHADMEGGRKGEGEWWCLYVGQHRRNRL